MDSPYTICREEPDGTYTLSVYASPKQYKKDGEYCLVDNSLTVSEEKTYSFENKAGAIKTYFPKGFPGVIEIRRGQQSMRLLFQGDFDGYSDGVAKTFTTCYGDSVEAIVYEREDRDIIVYPSGTGIHMELMVKRALQDNFLNWRVDCKSSGFQDNENGYILFRTGTTINGIVHQPLLCRGDSEPMEIYDAISVWKNASDYAVNLPMPQEGIRYPYRLDLAFELYENKLPDSTAYSQRPVNAYLSNVALLGNSEWGEGRHYSRLRVSYFMTMSSNDVLSATYHFRKLSGSATSPVIAKRVNSQWSSTQLLWNSQPSLGDALGVAKPDDEDKWYSVDITDFIRECLKDPLWETESKGFALSCENGSGSLLIATSDHTLYSPYLELKLRKLPVYFEGKANINDTLY